MMTNEKYRLKEQNKFDAEIRNKLERKPAYSFSRLPGGVKVVGGIIAVGLLAVKVALAI